MNLHEYQSKGLLAGYKIPVPAHEVVWNPDMAMDAINSLGGDRWIVKAQVHAGGRGKAGGVRMVADKDELIRVVKEMIGTRLVTHQTDALGQPINQLLVEMPSEIKQELYLGAVVDRVTQRIVFMASTEGGMEIEEVAENTPEKIHRVIVDPVVGLQPYQCRDLFYQLKMTDAVLQREFVSLMMKLYQMFLEKDLSLLEINPLVITPDDHLICLDAKINIDDSALYRQPDLKNMRDSAQEDDREVRARQWELSYIALDGDIGCMVNGAGLAMATMDLIQLQGGTPANFLDVGGGATQERVREAFKIILSDDSVKGVFVNIFGGIVRCDLIADGILGAVEEVGVTVPVVVRLEGNQAEVARDKLTESSLSVEAINDFTEAAKRIVELVQTTA